MKQKETVDVGILLGRGKLRKKELSFLFGIVGLRSPYIWKGEENNRENCKRFLL
ncbi:hypothetical protein [Bacillus spizizenii]|uniref:hypothetical protein n=1 Tax=Bacillus spizizenii TaxID=96241 RepID=UPI0002FEC4BD|nr:hypothetical protein [Bacillus spizizenii]